MVCILLDFHRKSFNKKMIITVTIYEPRHEKNNKSAYAKTKTQISFAVTAKLISAFVFATWTV